MDEELFGTEEYSIDDLAELAIKTEDDDDLSDDDDEQDEDPQVTDEDDLEDEDEDDSEEDDEDSDEDPDDDPDTDDEDEDDESDDEDDAPLADDESEAVITVDGKEHRVSVSDLKRLYGQEASLTQKSQALSTQRRAVDEQGAYLATILQSRYEAAKANVEKYKDVDLFKASRELEPEDFDALKAAKEAADNELTTLEREGTEFLQNTQKHRAEILKSQAIEAVKQINDPSSPNHIEGWNDGMYNDIRSFAVSQGMDANTVNELVDPAAIKLLNMALQFSKAQETTKAKVKKKIAKAPKKVVRKSEKTTNTKSSKVKALRKQVSVEDGDVDSVTDLFLAALED